MVSSGQRLAEIWDFDRVRYLPHPWERVADLITGDVSRWLPAPLAMVGIHELVGDLRVWGVWLDVDYTVTDPWRKDQEVSRRIRVSLRHDGFASVEGDLGVRPQREDLTMARFVGKRASPPPGWSGWPVV